MAPFEGGHPIPRLHTPLRLEFGVAGLLFLTVVVRFCDLRCFFNLFCPVVEAAVSY